MDHRELLARYQALLTENECLKTDIATLKAHLSIMESLMPPERTAPLPEPPSIRSLNTPPDNVTAPVIHNRSDSADKIRLFMSLFRGRDDVYAQRWESSRKGTSGYSPVCRNEWLSGVCAKPKGSCAGCASKAYLPLNEGVIGDHLRGLDDLVVGMYPLLRDETCWFLAIDFDDEGWRRDVSAVREVCAEYDIPLAVERSRSGNGAHAWFFFTEPQPATVARKFGSALLTRAMNSRHELSFASYDRLFPSQDTMPKGGLGNLIALPLQKVARKSGNSEFIDENFVPYDDQWAYLATLRKLSGDNVTSLTARLCRGSELGALRQDEGEAGKPWETTTVRLSRSDFPDGITVVRANLLFIPKSGISQRALNQLKRLAAFTNPEFYKAQALRMPTYDKPRIICCAEETDEYLGLPRGCGSDVDCLLATQGVHVRYEEKTNSGRCIDVEFNGVLRDEQPKALDKLLEYDLGVLSGTTAFGKTVVAIRLIAERKVNTLILVDRVSLVAQWEKRLREFLTIHEALPELEGVGQKRRGRKKVREIIGHLRAGKDNLSGIIDIAVMQSLTRKGAVRECVTGYGMVIVDECHHVSAVSFETILKRVTARYVYGLTATPARKDGHQPIIFMQCGPIRYRDDAKKQAERRPFEHYVIPRFTGLRIPPETSEADMTIQEIYADIVGNEARNQLIVDDVVKGHEQRRNCLVLTERTAHVELLARRLSNRIPDVIALTGGMGTKESRRVAEQLAATSPDTPLTLVATGRFIGEGFDEPRLDTLFLAMPISWKGTLQQYAGRLHRLFENKSEVQIYDYVDIHVRKLERMYHKRLNGYAAIGYKAKGESTAPDPLNFIFDKDNFLPVFTNDCATAAREILIVSPFLTRRRTEQMLPLLESALKRTERIIVVTRPMDDFRGKDTTAVRDTVSLLHGAGITLVYRPSIHQKFAVVDQRVVWYGSINLLSFGSAEESVMRLESPNIANELIRSVL